MPSLETMRTAELLVLSSPIIIQPKLSAVPSSQACTSAMSALLSKVAVEPLPTCWLALAVASKSPPALDQDEVLKKLKFQVASPSAAVVPRPSCPGALDVLSPQSVVKRCKEKFLDSPRLPLTESCTLVIVAPAGIPEISNWIRARLKSPLFVRPANILLPLPLLLLFSL